MAKAGRMSDGGWKVKESMVLNLAYTKGSTEDSSWLAQQHLLA
jgi:hypothetical protein